MNKKDNSHDRNLQRWLIEIIKVKIKLASEIMNKKDNTIRQLLIDKIYMN